MEGDAVRELLPRAVRALSGSTNAARALNDLAGLIVPALADWFLADELQPPDLVTRLVAVGRDGPLGPPPGLGPVETRRSSAQTVGLLARLLDAPGRRLRLSVEQLGPLTGSPDERVRAQVELALALGATDVLLLGLTSQHDLLGVMTLGRSGGEFSAQDLEQLTDIAALAGLALDRGRLRRLQRSVSTALQQSLLPQLPLVSGLTLAARFTPVGQGLDVGGDWYDAFVLPGGDVAMVVGDATGHDALAAARMAELRNLLRAVAIDRLDPPAGTLTRLDEILAQVAGGLSGTCVYAQVTSTADGGSLRWSSAGHLPPVLLRAGVAELLDTPPDLMLGVQPDTPRVDHSRELQDGDLLVFYTDGLVEDRRTGLDERMEVLRRLVEQHASDGPEVLADRLVRELASREDDVAVLVARVDAPGRPRAVP